VNDKRVHEVSLRHGDHIRLGQAEFVFLTREHGVPEPASRRWIGIVALLLAAAGALAWWLLRSP
jgi:pSer/pThr/pTyr-binding forkhead associated (FHA) protein